MARIISKHNDAEACGIYGSVVFLCKRTIMRADGTLMSRPGLLSVLPKVEYPALSEAQAECVLDQAIDSPNVAS